MEDNSKNLIKQKDTDLINTMNTLDKTNRSILDTAPILPGLKSGIQITQTKKLLELIQKDLDPALINLLKLKFTLSNKIQAQNVLKAMGKALREMIQTLNQNLTTKAQSLAPALPPRGTAQQQSRPLPAAPAAPASPSKFVLTEDMQRWLKDRVSFELKGIIRRNPIDATRLQNELEKELSYFKGQLRSFKNIVLEASQQEAINSIRDVFSKKIMTTI